MKTTTSFKDYIRYLGEDAAGKLFGVSPFTVRSWKYGTRQPRTKDIPKLIAASGGKLTPDSFFVDVNDSSAASEG